MQFIRGEDGSRFVPASAEGRERNEPDREACKTPEHGLQLRQAVADGFEAWPCATVPERCDMTTCVFGVRPNVGVKLTAEADGAWPRKGKCYWPLERPGDGRRSGSA